MLPNVWHALIIVQITILFNYFPEHEGDGDAEMVPQDGDADSPPAADGDADAGHNNGEHMDHAPEEMR